MSAVEQDPIEVLADGEPAYWEDPAAPENADDADWHGWHIRKIQEQADQVTATYQTSIDKLTAARDELLATITGRADWHRQALEMWHRAIRRADPKRPATEHLPSIDCASKGQPPEWVYEDEAAFIAWAAESAPKLLRNLAPSDDELLAWAREHYPPVAIEKADVKKALGLPEVKPGESGPPTLPDGTPVPGVVVTVREPKFWLELDGRKVGG